MVRIPLEVVDDATWVALRRLAYQCATFGNALLSASYVEAKGVGDVAGMQRMAYKLAGEHLAAAVRDAVSRECVGLWRRLGKKILRGEQTLARFSADRALVVRDRGVHLARESGGDLICGLRVHPQAAGPVTRLAVWMPALRKDAWLRGCLDRLWSGEWPVTKASVQFERPGRKVFVRLTYARPADAASPASQTATLTWTAGVEGASRVGELWLRANGRALSLNDTASRLAAMKAHFAGIHARLRQDLAKRGRRRACRRALVAAGSFETWAAGPLHELSRQIVRWCQDEGAGMLVVSLPMDGTLPWTRVIQMLTYKGEEVGLVVSQLADDLA